MISRWVLKEKFDEESFVVNNQFGKPRKRRSLSSEKTPLSGAFPRWEGRRSSKTKASRAHTIDV
jgi:hypothetical protein